MVSNQSKLKRSIPLLLALVVLISCLPVIPVAADEIYWLDGTWKFNYEISWSSDFDFFYPSFVSIDGTSFHAFNYIYSESELWLYNQGEDACAFDSGFWNGHLPVVVFSERVQVTKDEYDFFQRNLTHTSSPSLTYSLIIDDHLEHSHTETWYCQATVEASRSTFNCDLCSWDFIFSPSGAGTFSGFEDASGNTYWGQCQFDVDASELRLISTYSTTTDPDPGPSVTYTSTITIDGQKFIFTSTTEQPAALLHVTSSGAILSYGDQTLTFTYEGDGNFLGLGYSPVMDPSYLPGESYPLAAGSHTLKSVNDGTGTGSGPFETTIVIDGSVFQFFSDTEYPLVTCYLSSNGVRLVCGDDVRMWRPKHNEEFLGLSLSPNSSEPSYTLSDEWFMVRGSSTKYAFEYYSYCVEFEENELARIFKATATMILVPVSVFFTTEFIPGLPIGSVMLISFVVGLLFFFLKSSK